ncbi:MAG: trehalose-phosphatase [Burkholderiales bacterium]|nr:trehalose-phosphatase [Burkholderiales bacterium]
MRHLFSPAGERALDTVLRRQPLLAFDFDGTLAPIVARPDDAKVSRALAHWLEQLARLRPVAIVTGRSVADVTPRLGFEPRFIIGNHGAEDPARAPSIAAGTGLESLRRQLAGQSAELQAAGVQIEDKQYSMALHYRLARDRGRAEATIAQTLQGLDPALHAFGGKCVVNIVEAAAPDKGDAVIELVRATGADSALFVGDDVNDEAVFVRAAPDWLTVRIGLDNPESSARYFLNCHAEMAALLQKMLQILETA